MQAIAGPEINFSIKVPIGDRKQKHLVTRLVSVCNFFPPKHSFDIKKNTVTGISTIKGINKSRVGEREVFEKPLTIPEYCVSLHVNSHCHPGGVLRYISDGEVRSPFLGLKSAILDFF